MKATLKRPNGDVIEYDGTPEEIARVVTPDPGGSPVCIPSVYAFPLGCAQCAGRYAFGLGEAGAACGRLLPGFTGGPIWYADPKGTTVTSDPDMLTFTFNPDALAFSGCWSNWPAEGVAGNGP